MCMSVILEGQNFIVFLRKWELLILLVDHYLLIKLMGRF